MEEKRLAPGGKILSGESLISLASLPPDAGFISRPCCRTSLHQLQFLRERKRRRSRNLFFDYSISNSQ